jgi:uncharacterized damage-inducible protein DinB
MTPILKPIAASIRTTDMIVSLALTDLEERHAKQRVRSGTGPSITWEMGHLLDGRVQALKFLGVMRENPYAAYGPGAASDGADYPSLPDLLDEWRRLSDELGVAMEEATEESLLRKVKAGAHGEENVLAKLSFQFWHEAYHIGALGTIRKELGYPGPAELVMARMAAAR